MRSSLPMAAWPGPFSCSNAVKPPAEAPLGDIAQGVVYEFAPGSVNRYG
jgi:hypothetical protein